MNTSLIDKIILRGIIPLVLTIAAPWAAYHFSMKADAVQEKTEQLGALIEKQEKLEEAKAIELSAMSAMVTQLDETLKAALVQTAVLQELRIDQSRWTRPARTRDEVVRDVTKQIVLPGLKGGDVSRLAGEAYDRAKRR